MMHTVNGPEVHIPGRIEYLHMYGGKMVQFWTGGDVEVSNKFENKYLSVQVQFGKEQEVLDETQPLCDIIPGVHCCMIVSAC